MKAQKKSHPQRQSKSRQVEQNEIDNWTDEDEVLLSKLIKKRLATNRGTSSHDIKFVSDLLDGEEAERLIVEAFKKAEIKRDYRAGTTGNVFVEYKQGDKDSGITVSESDYWIFVLSCEEFDNEVFIGIHKDRLSHIVDSTKWSVNGGDNNASKGKLIKLSKLLQGNTKLGFVRLSEESLRTHKSSQEDLEW